jgi:hypothetical protein
VRIFCLPVIDEDPQSNSNLWSCKTNTWGLLHREVHLINQSSDFVVYLADFLSTLVEHGLPGNYDSLNWHHVNLADFQVSELNFGGALGLGVWLWLTKPVFSPSLSPL